MNGLIPCPFCGNKMDEFPDYTITYNLERRKRFGIHHMICTLKCNRCSCTVSQAGATREEAEKHVANLWNRRTTHER